MKDIQELNDLIEKAEYKASGYLIQGRFGIMFAKPIVQYKDKLKRIVGVIQENPEVLEVDSTFKALSELLESKAI